jgi:anti-sigma B factor antagonist
MSERSTCALWEEPCGGNPDKESQLTLNLKTRVTDDVTVVHCEGRMVYGIESALLSGEVSELLPQTRQLVIELSGVEMMDGSGLGELISVLVSAQANQCSIKLAAPRERILQLLKLTNLTSVFDIHPSLDEATLAFGETSCLQ